MPRETASVAFSRPPVPSLQAGTGRVCLRLLRGLWGVAPRTRGLHGLPACMAWKEGPVNPYLLATCTVCGEPMPCLETRALEEPEPYKEPIRDCTECGQPVRARGLCSAHYRRWWRANR
jgi:hypothetical protein